MMHSKYLPFTEKELFSHFADIKGGVVRHLTYYQESIRRYKEFCKKTSNRKGISLSEMKLPCQIEKDEKFWIAATMMGVFHNKTRVEDLTRLFTMAFGDVPPIDGLSDWEDCFPENLHLFFEVSLPSPPSYNAWLLENRDKRHFIPYVLDSAQDSKHLEGKTNVDALLVNSENGFAVVIEAKVLSDTSYETTRDVTRNQLARNIDVMLERNDRLCDPLNRRDPAKTIFLLVTPRLFKDNPKSRLYGFKLNEYKSDPSSLAQDLPHRTDCDWKAISKRIGWLTWEDFRDVNKDCCQWLK